MKTTDHAPFPYGFIVAEHDVRHQRVIAVSASGEIVHCYKCDDLPLDLDLRADGHLLLTTRKAVIELDRNWQEIWRYEIDDVFVTACQWLADDLRLVADTSCAQIYRIDRQCKKQEAVNIPVTPDLQPAYNLFRNVCQLDNGHLLVACHHDRKIAVLDWSGVLLWQAPVDGTPYQALKMPNGNILASLGPSGRIVEIDRSGFTTTSYDMVTDHGLERGWIAGITFQPGGPVTYSDSKYDRLVAFNWQTKQLIGVFQNRDVLLHPSTHIITS